MVVLSVVGCLLASGLFWWFLRSDGTHRAWSLGRSGELRPPEDQRIEASRPLVATREYSDKAIPIGSATTRVRVQDRAGILIPEARLQWVRRSPGSEEDSDLPTIVDPEPRAGEWVVVWPPKLDTALFRISARGYVPQLVRLSTEEETRDIPLAASAPLTVRVLDQAGLPLVGATVFLGHAAGEGWLQDELTTDTDGRAYFLARPPVGRVCVRLSGFGPRSRSLHTASGPEEMEIRIQRLAGLRVQIVDAENDVPLPGIRVSTWSFHRVSVDRSHGRSGFAFSLDEGVSRSDGICALRFPWPREETKEGESPQGDGCGLWIEGAGWAPRWVDADQMSLSGLGEGCEVPRVEGEAMTSREGVGASLYRLRLCRSGVVEGFVRDSAGLGVPGQRVWASDTEMPLITSATQNRRAVEAGYFLAMRRGPDPRPTLPYHGRLEAVTDAQGAYRIEGIPCRPRGTPVSLALAGYDQAKHPGVVANVQPAVSVRAPDLTLDLRDEWSFARGRVVNLSGEPVPGAMISDGLFSTRALADGNFTLSAPTTLASLSLRVSAPGYQTQRFLLDRQADPNPTITLATSTRFCVEVRDAEGRLAQGVQVLVTKAGNLDRLLDRPRWASASMDFHSATTDARGLAAFDDAPDVFDLAARVLRGGQVLECVRKHGLAAGNRNSPWELRLVRSRLSEARWTLALRILEGNPRRLIDREATVVLWRGEMIEREGLALRGVMEFHHLDDTPLTIEIRPRGSPPVRQIWDPRSSPPTCEVTVPEGFRVTGVVRSQDGRPLERAGVAACREGESDCMWIQADGRGQFEFSTLPAGHYRLWSAPLSPEMESSLGDLRPDRESAGAEVGVDVWGDRNGIVVIGSRWETAELSVQVPSALAQKIDGAGDAALELAGEWARELEAVIQAIDSPEQKRMHIVSVTNRAALFRALLPGGEFRVVVSDRGRAVATAQGRCGIRVVVQASP